MAASKERHNPHFLLLPVNNNRTAWRPFGLPVILVVPHSRDTGGRPIKGSGVRNVAIIIEGAPTEALVSGHDHVGIRFPDRELHRRSLTARELLERQINTDLLDFESPTGVAITDRSTIQTGDIIRYTTASGVFDKFVFLADADYFDLSDILLETEQLPAKHYNLIYICAFDVRVVAKEQTLGVDELICVDINHTGQATMRFGLNHPGEVIQEFHNLTPPIYLSSGSKSTDSALHFYRPFTDILQDIYDEQKFIKMMNWVHQVPYEAIPYLSQLLGWDVPYFPESLDQLRRLILRKTRQLQSLKGSKRAIRELMNLFGFTVLFKNMWYAVDGSRFISPGENLPAQYDDQQVIFIERFQVEPILSDFQTVGFGNITANLLFRPQRLSGQDPFRAPEDSSDLTIDAYLVKTGSAADAALSAQVALMEADPEEYGQTASCIQDDFGFINIGRIHTALAGLTTVGHSQILVRGGFGVDQAIAGVEPPFRVVGPPLLGGISFDKGDNTISLIFDHHLDFATDGTTIYVFASYKRQETVVPTALTDMRSNRFGIQILTKSGVDLRPDVLDFVLDFIHKIKAFHSLLDSIQYRAELTEAYLVTDLCAGGDVTQRYDVAIGRLQVPPAFIPIVPGENCIQMTPTGLGYRDIDITYRRLLLGAILEEFAAWKALDTRQPATDLLLRVAAALAADRTACLYNPRGQDRVIGDADSERVIESSPTPTANSNSALDHLSPYHDAAAGVGVGPVSVVSSNPAFSTVNVETDTARTAWCTLDAKTDYCYRGRVAGDILMRLSPALTDVRRNLACGLGLGTGQYWTYPTSSRRHRAGVKSPAYRSRSRHSVYSGGATDVYQSPLTAGPQGNHLLADPTQPLPPASNNYLGRLLRSYGQPLSESIHFSDRPYLTKFDQSQWLALQRPSLEINHQVLHFPGCRFPMLGQLKNDYVSTDWAARPWDDLYSDDNPCCHGTPTWLNAELTTDGTSLAFDSAPFTVTGNNLDQDIASLSVHTVPAGHVAANIVHAIYSSQATGHAAIISDEDMVDCGTPGDVLSVDAPLFTSAAGTDTGGYIDFCDGYPAESGYFDYDDLDLGRAGLYQDLFEALDIPGISFAGTGGTNSIELLFYLGSGIKDGSLGVRLDCGCQVAADAGTTDQRLGCATDLYLTQNDDYDFDGDHIIMLRNLAPEDQLDAGPYLLDGSIPSLMELIVS